MPFLTVRCPHCQRELRMPMSAMGDVMKCPVCGQVLRVTDPCIVVGEKKADEQTEEKEVT